MGHHPKWNSFEPMTMGELVLSDKYINPTCINEYRVRSKKLLYDPYLDCQKLNMDHDKALVIFHAQRVYF